MVRNFDLGEDRVRFVFRYIERVSIKKFGCRMTGCL